MADTCLHIVTEATLISQVTPVETPTHSLGFDFFPKCAAIHDGTAQLSEVCHSLLYGVIDKPAQPYLVINNLSDTYQVRRHVEAGNTFSYLAPVSPPATIDYQAHTLAASSHCEPYTRQCNLRAENSTGVVFNCSENFHGAMTLDDASKGTVCDREGCMEQFTDPGLNHTENMNTGHAVC